MHKKPKRLDRVNTSQGFNMSKNAAARLISKTQNSITSRQFCFLFTMITGYPSKPE